MRTGGGCEAAVTARTRCGWIKFMECGELLHSDRSHQNLKATIYKNYVRPANMVPEGKRDGNFTKDREIHGESNA